MAAERPGRQQGPHLPGFGQGNRHLPGENRGDADIHLPEAAHIIPARRQHLAELGPAVGHGDFRLQGHPQHFPGIGGEAGGDIHRQNLGPQVVEPLDQGGHQPLHRGIEAGAQQGVHDEAGFGQPVDGRVQVRFGEDLRHRDPQVGQDLQVDPGIPAHLVPRPQEEHGHRDAGIGQVAGHHEPVAAVVAPSGHHRHFARGARKFPPKNLVGRPPGILHKDQGRDAQVLDGPAVQLPHLRCRYEFHISTWV